MLKDVVIDTNILMHASDPRQKFQGACVAFLKGIESSEIKICVDEGFSVRESDNRSIIGSEYLRHIRYGSLSYAVIFNLATKRRIKVLSKSVPKDVKRKIERSINNRHDRVYVKITYNSLSKALISHDFDDISQKVRDDLKDSFSLSIVIADVGVELLR